MMNTKETIEYAEKRVPEILSELDAMRTKLTKEDPVSDMWLRVKTYELAVARLAARGIKSDDPDALAILEPLSALPLSMGP